MEPVRFKKVTVNRKPCSCVYDCPCMVMVSYDYTCGILLRNVNGYVSGILKDCPLVVGGDCEVTDV